MLYNVERLTERNIQNSIENSRKHNSFKKVLDIALKKALILLTFKYL